MPPLAGEPSSSNSVSRAVKIPTRHNLSDHHSPSSTHRHRQHLFNSSIVSETPSYSSSSLASSSESYDAPSYQQSHTSASAYPSTPDDMNLDSYSQSSSSEDNYDPRTPSTTQEMKAKAVDSSLNNTPALPSRSSPLGPAMLSSHTYKSINLNGPDPDDPPRLITFTRSGQGFTWNEELFLPSYMIGRYTGRGRRKQYDGDLGEDDVEVAEIFVTDEEAMKMLP